MQTKTINEVNEIYELEIPKIVRNIKQKKAKQVLLQFPEGLKPHAQVICDEIENKANCECFIWLTECFGACDVPDADSMDLIVQFGHSKLKFKSTQSI